MGFLSTLFSSGSKSQQQQPPVVPQQLQQPPQQQQQTDPLGDLAKMLGYSATPPQNMPQPPTPAQQQMQQMQQQAPAPQMQQQPKQPGFTGLPALDPNVLSATLSKANFAGDLPAELITQLQSGDASGLSNYINSAIARATQVAIMASHGYANSAASSAYAGLDGALDSRFRDFSVKAQTIANPVLANPAVQPLFDSVRAQIARANPSMSAETVQQQAMNYFMTVAQQITASSAPPAAAAAATQQSATGEGNSDFSSFFGNASQSASSDASATSASATS